MVFETKTNNASNFFDKLSMYNAQGINEGSSQHTNENSREYTLHHFDFGCCEVCGTAMCCGCQ